MLSHETQFPYVGSYALYADPDQPHPAPTELVRIQWRRSERRVGRDGRAEETAYVMVSFPLRDGASGNKVVAESELIDGTPLDDAETREFHDLDRALFGRSMRTARQKKLGARRDALKSRMIWSRFMAPKLAEMRRRGEATRRAA